VVLGETVALLVGLVIQVGIGQQIGKYATAGTHPGFLAIHIPLALLVFGLSVHLSSFVADVRRRG
jgi:predicted histidine transporter YuiF (NhaC family)